MRQSETIEALATALAKAQGTIKNALKDSVNPHFRSRYADLASVREACAEALSKNEIAVIQAHDMDDGGHFFLATRLVHKSGQWVESRYPIKPVKEDPQGFASATTYARRISLASMVGVVADDDDDGNAASAKSNGANEPLPAPQPTKAQTANDSKNKAIEWANNAHHDLGKMKAVTELNAWLGKNSAGLEKLRTVVPDEFVALDHKINVTADRLNSLVAG